MLTLHLLTILLYKSYYSVSLQELSSKDDICDLLPSVPVQAAPPQEEFYLKLHRKNSDVPGTHVKTVAKGSSSVRSGRVGQPRRDGQLHRTDHTSNVGHNGHHSYVENQSYNVNREHSTGNVSRSDKDFLSELGNHAAKNHGGFFVGEPLAALGHPKGVVRVRVNGHSVVSGHSSHSTTRKHRENPPNYFNHRTHPESTKGGRRYDESEGRTHTCICVNGPRERTVAAIRIAVEAAAAAVTADRGWRPEQGGGANGEAKYLDSSGCKYEPEDLRPVRKGTLR
jgi:hypothetical protein